MKSSDWDFVGVCESSAAGGLTCERLGAKLISKEELFAGGFALFLWEETEDRGLTEARTVVVHVIVMVELFYLLNWRSLTRPFFSLGIFSNLWVVGGVAAMIGAQLLFTYAPFMNKSFHSAPISPVAWLKIVGVSLVVFVAIELKKWLDARRQEGKSGDAAD